MLFGLPTNPAKNLVEEIRKIKEWEFDFVEISIETPLKKISKRIQKEITVFKLITVHLPWGAEIASPFEHVRKSWVEECKKIIENFMKIEANIFTIHPYFRPFPGCEEKRTRKNLLEQATKSLAELSDFTSEHGITLCVENILPPQLSDIEDLKEMFDNIKSLKMTLDIGHAYIKGGIKEIEELAKKFKRRIIHLHVHDNNGKVDEHLPLGVGTINFKGIAKTIKQLKNCKTVVLEIHRGRGEHILLSRKLLEEIWC